MRTQIVVIGHGKLANSILTNLDGVLRRRDAPLDFMANYDDIDSEDVRPEASVMIHAGSYTPGLAVSTVTLWSTPV